MLVSERNPERNRHNRTRTLPFSGLLRPVAIRGRARCAPEGGGLKLPVRVETLRANIRSILPVEPGNDPPIDPLYLFVCGLSWRKQGNASAGWELVRCLKRSGPTARMAAAFLAQAKDFELPLLDPMWVRDGPEKPSLENGPAIAGVTKAAATMNTPYGLEIIENCVSCKLRKDKWFCGLSPDVLKSFSAASHLSTYPGGAVLFVEGQTPRGALVLCSGKVKLSTTSREGKVLILKMAEPGEALGLSAVISGTPYELTAETAGPCQVNVIERESLMKLLDKYGELGLHSA